MGSPDGGAPAHEGSELLSRTLLLCFYAPQAETGPRHVEWVVDAAGARRNAPAMQSGRATCEIAASPEAVWVLISDIARTGEWSPECVRTEWLDGASLAAGSGFRGHNQQGQRTWSMDAVVDEVDEPRRFTFHTERDGRPRTRWTWDLAVSGTGTTLTESWERLFPTPVVQRVLELLLLGGRHRHNQRNLEASLARVKAILDP